MRQKALGAALCVVLASPSALADWDWSVTPYGWLPAVTVDTSVPEPSGSEADFGDLLDIIDFAALVHVEAQRDRLGFMGDVVNLQLSDRSGEGLFEVDTDLSMSLFEGAVTYAISEGSGRLEVIAGLRVVDVDLEIEVETRGPLQQRVVTDAGKTLTDGMLGLRYIVPLNEHWRVALRGDASTGDSEYTWNASAVFGRQIGDSGTLQLGYRHLVLDLEDIGPMDPEITFSGFQVGYTFHF